MAKATSSFHQATRHPIAVWLLLALGLVTVVGAPWLATAGR